MIVKDLQFRPSGDQIKDSELEELEVLEANVKEMAQKLLHYRTTLPDQLKATFSSIISSQRPLFLKFGSGSKPGASGEHNTDVGQDRDIESGKRVLLAEGDQETSEKIQLLKQKSSSNVSTIPVLLK